MAEETQEIKEITLSEIDPRYARQIENVEKNLSKSPDYAIDICNTVLGKYPNCVEVRKILRQAQYAKYGKGSAITKFVASIKAAIFAIKAKKMIESGDALGVIAGAEQLLNSCPDNPVACKLLIDAADSLGYFGVSITGYMAMTRYAPTDENLLALANAYIKNKQPDEAMQVCETILNKNRANGEAQALARTASVMKTMNKGKWEEEGSARTKVKDAKEQLARERQTSSVNDEETLKQFVEELKVKIAEDVQNINLYRDICKYLRELHRYSEALEYVRQARKQPLGAGDTTFEKLENDLVVLELDQNIEDIKKRLEANPDDASIKAELEEARKKEHAIKLANAKEMVERYPNDFNYRYVLGSLYLEDGVLDEAIKQLQVAQRSPKVRAQSLLGLGRAFFRGGKYDLAVEQLLTAKNEAKIMNESKKEIIYELASVYEKMGKPDLAFAEYKEIYTVDASYKDVSAKVDYYYSNKK